ncbi:hypothetical protein ACEQ8H_002378 [Pleosporales sp. CAS-2024a]
MGDDIVLLAASLCGLGTAIVISTAADSGLGKIQCLLASTELDDIQVKVFVSTILFVLALSISKCSVLMFLRHVADNTLQGRTGIMVIGVVVVVWTLAVMTGIIFECEMPRPWQIWTGKCIPMIPFWITATVVDMIIDIALFLLSIQTVWRLSLDHRQKNIAFSILSLRIMLIVASAMRLGYLNQALARLSDPTFHYIPYAISTLFQSTTSVILACALAFTPMTNMMFATASTPKSHRHSKDWSGSSIGGKPYESYASYQSNDPFGSQARIIAQEPLHTIQGSISSPTASPAASQNSFNNTMAARSKDIILPHVITPARYPLKAPTRPPPPCERDRPDLSMFTQTTVLREGPHSAINLRLTTNQASTIKRQKSLA